MPDIIFDIDEHGNLTTEIHGISGPSCEDVAKLVRAAMGQPGLDIKTPEFSQPVKPKQSVRGS